ncbi:uncharacterized protein [Ptychodera flava]|uniref:uncharacterized protein n=1 Tax=Ptychodera flava TaxID=63121 RepID=UPI003969FA82
MHMSFTYYVSCRYVHWTVKADGGSKIDLYDRTTITFEAGIGHSLTTVRYHITVPLTKLPRGQNYKLAGITCRQTSYKTHKGSTTMSMFTVSKLWVVVLYHVQISVIIPNHMEFSENTALVVGGPPYFLGDRWKPA